VKFGRMFLIALCFVVIATTWFGVYRQNREYFSWAEEHKGTYDLIMAPVQDGNTCILNLVDHGTKGDGWWYGVPPAQASLCSQLTAGQTVELVPVKKWKLFNPDYKDFMEVRKL